MKNVFYHNKITLTASKQVDCTYTVNTWDNDYPSGGNYWKNYNAVDQYSGVDQNIPGSDGISDAPYIIDTNNVDRYPLMQPWQSSYKINDGFESADFTGWTDVTNRTGEAEVTDLIQHHGNYSANFSSKGGDYEYDYCYRRLSMDELYVRGYFYVSESDITREGDRLYFIVLSAADGNGLTYAGWRRDNGYLKWCMTLRNDSGYIDLYSSTTPLLNHWYSVELHWVKDDDGFAELWLNGSLILASRADTAHYGNATQVRIGLAETKAGASTMYCDCISISSDYIGSETSLEIQQLLVTCNPQALIIESGKTSIITVHVTCRGKPVQGSMIILHIQEGGDLYPSTGVTNASGLFTSLFTAQAVSTQKLSKVTANASKTGYLTGQTQIQVTVNPKLITLTICSGSSAKLLVTDPSGRSSGFDAKSGATLRQIPNAT
jgi:hypothetical protein